MCKEYHHASIHNSILLSLPLIVGLDLFLLFFDCTSDFKSNCLLLLCSSQSAIDHTTKLEGEIRDERLKNVTSCFADGSRTVEDRVLPFHSGAKGYEVYLILHL